MKFSFPFGMKDRTYPIPAISAIFHKDKKNGWMMQRELRKIDSGYSIATAGKKHMGRKDTAGRDFFSDKKRFAEMLNIHLYHGDQVILADDLMCQQRNYASLTGVYGEKQRDILIADTRSGFHYGMELETESDYSMPERVMAYDVCEYEYQIRKIYRKHCEKNDFVDYCEKKSRMKALDYLHPTMTIVLYLGEGHWRGKCRLFEMFWPSEGEKNTEFLNNRFHDYDFLLIEADFVNPEDYQTDLREFFLAMQCRQDRKKLRELLRSEDFANLEPETEQMIAAHLNVKRLVHKIKKEGIPMCKAFEELMEEERENGKKEGRRKGKSEGRKEGKKEGRKEERFLIIRRMYKKGMEEKLILEMTGCTKKEFAIAISK